MWIAAMITGIAAALLPVGILSSLIGLNQVAVAMGMLDGIVVQQALTYYDRERRERR